MVGGRWTAEMKKLVGGHGHRFGTSGGLEDYNGYIYVSCVICGGWLKTHRQLGIQTGE